MRSEWSMCKCQLKKCWSTSGPKLNEKGDDDNPTVFFIQINLNLILDQDKLNFTCYSVNWKTNSNFVELDLNAQFYNVITWIDSVVYFCSIRDILYFVNCNEKTPSQIAFALTIFQYKRFTCTCASPRNKIHYSWRAAIYFAVNLAWKQQIPNFRVYVRVR